jgi:hypothetical protein
MSEPTMAEVVERVRGKVAPDGRAWLPCDLDGNPIPEVSVDLANLLAAYQSVREDKARLDWLEAFAQMGIYAEDSGVKSFDWSPKHGSLRANLDTARRTGGTE